jgi:hypothetical protein
VFEPLAATLGSGDSMQICIWAGDNMSERPFLAMACAQLALFRGEVTRVGE